MKAKRIEIWVGRNEDGSCDSVEPVYNLFDKDGVPDGSDGEVLTSWVDIMEFARRYQRLPRLAQRLLRCSGEDISDFHSLLGEMGYSLPTGEANYRVYRWVRLRFCGDDGRTMKDIVGVMNALLGLDENELLPDPEEAGGLRGRDRRAEFNARRNSRRKEAQNADAGRRKI